MIDKCTPRVFNPAVEARFPDRVKKKIILVHGGKEDVKSFFTIFKMQPCGVIKQVPTALCFI